MEELKPCPFCGGKASLEHSGIERCRNNENGDLITTWRVWCPSCGTEKKGGSTEYWVKKDETLCVTKASNDGRKKAIEAWNRRHNDAAEFTALQLANEDQAEKLRRSAERIAALERELQALREGKD